MEFTYNLALFYGENTSRPSQSVFEPAQKAFDQALETFKQRSTRDSKKTYQRFQGTSLRDVLDTVAKAQKRYDDDHAKSKARRCITELSKRICYYGNIMDVLVQHHPEYVALAWGAMKLVFGAIVEHEKLGRSIITGLCDIADALPRVELAAFLFPTDAVKQAVSLLYAHIIKFLLRALEWYEEGKIAHAIHSITKPAALRYDDLIEDIRRATRSIADSAVTSSQAEQRDMHLELQALTTLFTQLRKDIILDQSIKGSALLELRTTLSDIQWTQALAIVSSACNVDYKSNWQASIVIRDKHRISLNKSKCTPFWTSSQLQAWNTTDRSSSITLRSTFKNRLYIRDFGTNVIEQLLKSRVAVLWILRSKEECHYPVNQVLMSLIQQSLNLSIVSHVDSKLSFQLHQFMNAQTEDDYVALLGDILQHLKLVYIVVEAGALDPAGVSQCQEYLGTLSERISKKNAATIIKVMVLRYGPDNQHQRPSNSMELKIGKMSRRKGTKLPSEPLQSTAEGSRQHTRQGHTSSFQTSRRHERAVRAGAS